MIDLLVSVIILLFLARLGGALAEILGLSAIVGEIFAGIAVGPTLFPQFTTYFTESVLLEGLADIGIILLIFLVGLKINLKAFEKFLRAGAVIAMFGAFIPFFAGTYLGFAYFAWNPVQSLFLGGIMMASSMAIAGRMLYDSKLLHKRVGNLAIDAVLVGELLSLLMLIFLVQLAGNSAFSIQSLLKSTIYVAIFFTTVILLASYISKYIEILGRFLNLRVKEGLLSMVIILVFTLSLIAEAIGISMVIGAFLAGLILHERHLKKIEHEVYSMAYGLFIPLFFALLGIYVNIFEMISLWPFLLSIFAVALTSRLFGAYFGARISGMSSRNSFIVSLVMTPRAEVAFIIASVALLNGVYSVSDYSAVIGALILGIVVVPPVFRRVVNAK
ncbi:MAG: cation:proton antiporter [archaeon]|jgi:Kef-type K+ transport system membrane component KefB|nr:hypothetical protein [Euryarchaeota archaeon]MDP6704530.1 cation:proton antiporter [archaeon]HIK01170.1 cation:proton antiporter [Candidatus Undinarchaeales archaeon ERR594346 U_76725]|tara:strand:- start:68722 stop:69885 length:1164 start_codon:yes stop_codon:yes gene_type:complete